MALYQRSPYQTADAQQVLDNASDQEEEAMVNDYREQVQFDDGMSDLDRVTSIGGQMQDMQSQLLAAATPLEYGATLETKLASYDNYCSLFHYILNSEGPVDAEAPSVSRLATPSLFMQSLMSMTVFLGLGCYRRVHLPIRILLQIAQSHSSNEFERGRCPNTPR